MSEPQQGPGIKDDSAETPKQWGWSLGGLFKGARRMGAEVTALIRGRTPDEATDEPNEAPDGDSNAAPPESGPAWTRIKVLRQMTDRLRGAADEYLAVKLDEIEALVDAKLDEIEGRVDKKVLDLMEQLRKARDEELRHRLRLLKITLIFTVLVALISLVYKWVTQQMAA